MTETFNVVQLSTVISQVTAPAFLLSAAASTVLSPLREACNCTYTDATESTRWRASSR